MRNTPFTRIDTKLQEIIWRSSGHLRFSLSWCGFVLNVVQLLLVIDFHDCSLISASIAVVRGREDSNDSLIMSMAESVHNELMSSADHLQLILMQELLADIRTEGIASTSWGNSPSGLVLIGVRPQKVAHGSLRNNVLESIHFFDVVEGIDSRGESSVKAEEFGVNEGGEWQVRENVSKPLPDVIVAVFLQAFIVKAIDFIDFLALMVASQDGEPIFISALQSKNKREGLNRVIASIDVISHEKIVSVGRLATNSKKL